MVIDYRAVVNSRKVCYVRMGIEVSLMSNHITDEQRAQIGDAIRRLGVSEAAKRLGISNEALLRLAGGFGSQAGTEALAVQRLERLVP
jgi:hypothetical protein